VEFGFAGRDCPISRSSLDCFLCGLLGPFDNSGESLLKPRNVICTYDGNETESRVISVDDTWDVLIVVFII
jgi:hypothetical protein